MQFCLTDVNYLLAYRFNPCSKCFKNSFKITLLHSRCFKKNFSLYILRVFKLECNLNVKHCYEFIVAYSHL